MPNRDLRSFLKFVGERPFSQAVRVTDLSQVVHSFRAVWEGTTGWFSPGEPIPPVQAEPEPRVRQMQVGFNLLYQPRGTEATSFEQLRFFAAHYDVARIAIQVLKDEIAGLEWDVVAREEGEGDEYDEEIAEAKRFFEKPDRKHDWPTWLGLLLEDRLVIDALTLYPRPTRGGGLYALEVVDGATIKPLVDARGDIPDAPAPAYQQVLWGVPRGMWSTKQLLYIPQNLRSNTVYGYSEIEFIIYIVNMALRKRLKDLAYFTEGNIPAALMGVPDGWTPEQIEKYQQFFDAWLAGDLTRRSRIIFTPAGGRAGALALHEFAPFTGDPVFDKWLMQVTLAAIGPTPAELGFTEDVNRATGESQENVQYRRAIRRILRFVKGVVDRVLGEYLGYPFLQFKWLVEEHEDRLKDAQVSEIYNKFGAIQIDEVREELGKEPFGLPPFLMTPQGPLFVEELIAEYRRKASQGWQEPQPPQLPPGGPGAPPAGPGGMGEGEQQEGEPETGGPGAPGGEQGWWNPNASAWGEEEAGPPEKAMGDEPPGDNVVHIPGAGPTPVPDPAERERLRQLSYMAARDDLRRWRQVAKKAVREGRPVGTFRSEHIPLVLYAAVRGELEELDSKAAPDRPTFVATVFEKALEVLDQGEGEG